MSKRSVYAFVRHRIDSSWRSLVV